MWLRTCYYIIVIVIVESFLALMVMNLIDYSCYYIIAELLLPLLIMDLIILTLWHHCWVIASSDHHEYDYIIIHVITILLSHCFLCWSWIWLNYYSRNYIITESLLSLRIKNLIMLLFMSLHHCWVISTSDDHYNTRQGRSGLWL